LENPPKPHAFTSLPLQSSGGGSNDDDDDDSEGEGSVDSQDLDIYEGLVDQLENLRDVAEKADKGEELTDDDKAR
jgi:hypothetical protein